MKIWEKSLAPWPLTRRTEMGTTRHLISPYSSVFFSQNAEIIIRMLSTLLSWRQIPFDASVCSLSVLSDPKAGKPFGSLSFKFQLGMIETHSLLPNISPSMQRKCLSFSNLTQTLSWIKRNAAPSHKKPSLIFLSVKAPANCCQTVLQCHLVRQTHFHAASCWAWAHQSFYTTFYFFTNASLFFPYKPPPTSFHIQSPARLALSS